MARASLTEWDSTSMALCKLFEGHLLVGVIVAINGQTFTILVCIPHFAYCPSRFARPKATWKRGDLDLCGWPLVIGPPFSFCRRGMSVTSYWAIPIYKVTCDKIRPSDCWRASLIDRKGA